MKGCALEEVLDYGLLAQNNECSALSIEKIETHAGLILDLAAAEISTKKVTKIQSPKEFKLLRS